eukprot:8936598-Alexandrium_andersonii.AAC.1
MGARRSGSPERQGRQMCALGCLGIFAAGALLMGRRAARRVRLLTCPVTCGWALRPNTRVGLALLLAQ